jgi:hypothetical protein
MELKTSEVHHNREHWREREQLQHVPVYQSKELNDKTTEQHPNNDANQPGTTQTLSCRQSPVRISGRREEAMVLKPEIQLGADQGSTN